MARIDDRHFATLRLTLAWHGDRAEHTERFLARKVNFWRDIFPPGLREALQGAAEGDAATLHYAPGEVLAGPDDALVRRLPRRAWRGARVRGRAVTPRAGRFYPRGLFDHLPGVLPSDMRPCRVLEADDAGFTVDMNHPLAGRALSLRAEVENVARKDSDTGGRLFHWLEEVADNGPGMQDPRPLPGGLGTDWEGPDAFARADEADDAAYYAEPRLVDHVDARARAFLADAHAGLVPAGCRVLDLMSAMRTHLPEGHARVTGLGLNAAELDANPLLGERLVHDLNADPALPFPDTSFDAVLCALGVEYLTDPHAVLREAVRVLRPGGTLAVSVSDRWFPAKASALWLELHPFERVGWMLDLLDGAGLTALASGSVRNWWRPEDDPHIRETWVSDPVFTVHGVRP